MELFVNDVALVTVQRKENDFLEVSSRNVYTALFWEQFRYSLSNDSIQRWLLYLQYLKTMLYYTDC